MRFMISLLLIFFFCASALAAGETRFFLTIADIHFDPFIGCGRSACPLVNQLKQASIQQWPALFKANDKKISRYGQDSDYLLLHSALAAAKEKAAAQPIQFVLVLGDSIGHDYRRDYRHYTGDRSRAGYEAFVRKTLDFLNAELAKTFPNTDVYMVTGNNDSFSGNYVSDPNGAFYHSIGTLWSTLIKEPSVRAAMRAEFAAAGYYAVTVPNQPNLRLIVLNTVLFSYKARGKYVTQAAEQELNWLSQQLQLAKKNHQKALIALHIPPGVDLYATLRLKLFTLVELWRPAYMQRFREELTANAANLVGVFAGHLHSDWFQILILDNHEIPVTGTPSISPIFGNNPGFKLYAYTPDTLTIKKYDTYYYPLNEMQPWQVRKESPAVVNEGWHGF